MTESCRLITEEQYKEWKDSLIKVEQKWSSSGQVVVK